MGFEGVLTETINTSSFTPVVTSWPALMLYRYTILHRHPVVKPRDDDGGNDKDRAYETLTSES